VVEACKAWCKKQASCVQASTSSNLHALTAKKTHMCCTESVSTIARMVALEVVGARMGRLKQPAEQLEGFHQF
jgi:hypothetical protein